MLKKIAIMLAVVATLALTLTAAANCGKCPADKGCPKKAADSKGCGMHGTSCPHMADMQAAFKALEADMATMEKGVPAADQATFMKEHQANLKKLLDARAACMKECKMKAETKEAPKAEAKTDTKAPTKG